MSNPQDKKPVILPDENIPINFEFERMIKNFIKQVRKDGILDEVKKRKYYMKPSEIKTLAKRTKKGNQR